MDQTTLHEPAPKPLLTIRPRSAWAALQVGEVWRFRDLLLGLAGRDVRLRYKQTALGVMWVVLQPLLGAAIFAFVFGKVAKLNSGPVPYFLFSYVGLLGWNVFSTILTKSSSCLIGNAQLISKSYFPRLILPLSTVPSALIDFGVALALLLVLMPVYGVVPDTRMLLLPAWISLIVLLAVGCGLITSALTVSYRDVQYILPAIMQLLLYASPVAYPVAAVPARFRFLYSVNPLSGLLEAFRWSLLGKAVGMVGLTELAYCTTFSIAVFFAGVFCFNSMERRFADVI